METETVTPQPPPQPTITCYCVPVDMWHDTFCLSLNARNPTKKQRQRARALLEKMALPVVQVTLKSP